jgi:putative hydrolase of the HAD superfamily
MKTYKHIFFDLDHTLWDFDKNCDETLEELFDIFKLNKLKIELPDLIEKYKLINNKMWVDYNRGEIKKHEIRNTRFELTFEALNLSKADVPEKLNEEFLRICPAKGNLLPFAHEVLTYLKEKYSLHIITNGFKETQHIKIHTSGLEKYFVATINSEACGYLKPNKKIFEYALQKVNSNGKHCIMIGDDLYTDISGAKNAGIDHVYFNRKEQKHNEDIMHEIKCLSELKNIL